MKDTNYIIIDRITDEYLSGWSFDDPDLEKWNSDYDGDGIAADCFLFKNIEDAKRAKAILDEAFSSRGEEINFEIVRVVAVTRYKIMGA